MTKEYDAAQHEHQGWATNDAHGNTIIKAFIDGKDETDAPILLDQWWITQRLSHLEGKILTVIEATVVKDNQKATKDIVRNYVGELFAEIVNTSHTEEYTQYMCDMTNTRK